MKKITYTFKSKTSGQTTVESHEIDSSVNLLDWARENLPQYFTGNYNLVSVIVPHDKGE